MYKQIFLKVPFRIEGALELLYLRQGYVMAGNVGDRVKLPMPSLHTVEPVSQDSNFIGVKVKS